MNANVKKFHLDPRNTSSSRPQHSLLLPNEPIILRKSTQEKLTQKFLIPVLGELEAFLLALRLQLDPGLQSEKPIKLGKPYPLGQCLEIATAVQAQLRILIGAQPSPSEALGLSAIRSFRKNGGEIRLAWGDLREKYFQNALLVGTLYVDVANDTVDPAKPKVEIMPFDEANFTAIRDYKHFRMLASTYWKSKFYPNHVSYVLAPHFPLIQLSSSGRVTFCEPSRYMLAMTRLRCFTPSEEILRESPIPDHLFNKLSSILKKAGHKIPRDAVHGRQLSLEQCSRSREKRHHQNQESLFLATQKAWKNNLLLAKEHVTLEPQSLKTKSSGTLCLDSLNYDLDTISAKSREHVASIQFIDRELARIASEIKILQTARSAYFAAISGQLKGVRPLLPLSVSPRC